MALRTSLMRTGGATRGALARSLLIQKPSRELMPGDLIGAFRIVREHSRGGMAIVYLAERADGEFNQRVALKWMQQDSNDHLAARLFEREREYVASLEHPNIAHLLDGGREQDGAMWFAMEWVDGLPIDHYCQLNRCDLATRVGFVIALCEAIGSAHAKLLLHRDIKPANVLVTARGHVKLLDFGVAQMLGQDDPILARALTLAFASPEQIAGDPLGITSDVYQLGVLLGVLLDLAPVLRTLSNTLHASSDPATSAASPSRRETDVEAENSGARSSASARVTTASMIRHSPSWPKLPTDLRAIIAKAIADTPQQRYVSAEALRADLQRFLAQQPVSARADRWHYRASCFLRRHLVATTLAVLGFCAISVLGWRVWVERDIARHEAGQARLEAERARASVDFVRELLNWSKPDAHKGRAVSVDEALKYAVDQLESTLKDQPRARGELSLLFSNVYHGRKEFERALMLAENAYSLLEADPLTDTIMRARVSVRLAMALRDQLQRDRSIEMAKRTLALLETIVPSQAQVSVLNDKEVARLALAAYHIWAMRLVQQGETERAAQIVASGLAYAEHNNFGLDASVVPPVWRDSEALLSLEYLKVQILEMQGEFRQAGVLRKTLLSRYERSMGLDDPDTGVVRGAQINSYVQSGDLQAARALAKTQLASAAKVWGKDHPQYARSLYQSAAIAREEQDYEKARTDLRAAIEIGIAAGEDGKVNLRIQYEALAVVEEDAGDFYAAEAALRNALRPDLILAARSPNLGAGRLKLARVLMRLKRFDEVPEMLAQARMEMRTVNAKHARWAILYELTADLAVHEAESTADALKRQSSIASARENYQLAIDQLQHAQTNSRESDQKRNQDKLAAIGS